MPARATVKDDTGLDPELVATLPVVLATALRAIKNVGEVKAGDHVLVHAGASGSGSMLIQMAKALGAKVATTIRNEDKREFAEHTGADLVNNMKTEDFVTFNVQSLFFPQKQLRGTMASDIEDLQWGLEQIKAGRIKPLLDRALPLSEAAEAHRLIANNEVKGSIVLLPWAE